MNYNIQTIILLHLIVGARDVGMRGQTIMTFNENLEAFYKKTYEALEAFEKCVDGTAYYCKDSRDGDENLHYVINMMYNGFNLLNTSIEELERIKN